MMKLNLGEDFLNKLFPFYIAINGEGQILKFGPSLKKLFSTKHQEIVNASESDLAKCPVHFNDYFNIARPANTDLKQLIEHSLGEMIVVRSNTPNSELMGQILPSNTENQFLFILNLVVQDADELSGLNLDFNDFAIQDPIFDYLMLLQTQRRAIKQADELNKQLAEAHKIAVKASQTKSQFLANMSHELRTPLNGLLGMSSILIETPLSEEQKDYTKTIMQSAETLLTLVNDILDLSKIEAGYIQLEKTKFNFKELINEITATVEPLVLKKKINFSLSISDSTPLEIINDRNRLRQVILNLVGNAVKFTLKGGVTISTTTSQDNVLNITIKDSGIGMSQDVLKQIFTPFVQGDSSMTKKFEGTGLGLSICKKLVESMEGEISVTSVEGQGSEFTLKIPLPTSLS